jgi:parvulin-like peptidyl-prolyl isomerase
MTLGGVVAEVNGTPIFANKVLALLDESLKVKARQLDAVTFRKQATLDIDNQIRELVRNELEYAAAQRNLDMEDRRNAELATIGWRQQQLTQAGGSLELARRRAAESGISFEDQLEERKRIELIRLYYQKKVYPKIQVSADDIRAYYDKNDEQYTEHEKVTFRLLKVDIKKTGNKDKAILKVADKHKRAKAGEDFKEMVLKENDEQMFARPDMGEMSAKSFAITKVRDALEDLQPGQISDVIEDSGAFYIVQLVDRKGGATRSFSDQKVQDDIRFKLRTEQLRVLSDQKRNELLKGAIINHTPQMRDIAVDMAMQKYAQYAKK